MEPVHMDPAWGRPRQLPGTQADNPRGKSRGKPLRRRSSQPPTGHPSIETKQLIDLEHSQPHPNRPYLLPLASCLLLFAFKTEGEARQ